MDTNDDRKVRLRHLVLCLEEAMRDAQALQKSSEEPSANIAWEETACDIARLLVRVQNTVGPE